MGKFEWCCAGIVAGGWLVALIFWSTGALVVDARVAYNRCITDGAPQSSCLKNYLLPKE